MSNINAVKKNFSQEDFRCTPLTCTPLTCTPLIDNMYKVSRRCPCTSIQGAVYN